MLSSDNKEGVANPLALSLEDKLKLAFQETFDVIHPGVKVLYVDLDESNDE
tara:strand:+ start:6911 stop:7063 length:153 start_codon:yes stop_codon:yes gene_type:complete